MLFYSLVYIFILFIGWTYVCPQDALVVIANLKRQIQRYAIQRKVRQEAQWLAVEMKKWCEQVGYEPEIVDEVLDEHLQKISKRLEDKYSQADLEDLS